jgi:GxxExxY protein
VIFVANFLPFNEERTTAMAWDNINSLCDIVRETSFAIHCYHRNGHLEKVYENALAHRLRKRGLKVFQQHPLTVFDEDGTMLGEYFADLLVEDCLIIELKACKTIADEHVAQILGYLRSSRMENGLLINFGSSKLYVKKYIMSVKQAEGNESAIEPG